MDSYQKEKLLKSLIKDDLINLKLIYGLRDLGIEASEYYLHASETVFDLLGFNESTLADALFEYYINLTEDVRDINIPDERYLLDSLAEDILNKLINKSISKQQ